MLLTEQVGLTTQGEDSEAVQFLLGLNIPSAI